MKIVIIGAGPGGCAAAIALARHGLRDVLLVDRASFPRDKTCGSAISPLGLRVLEELDVDRDVRRLGYPIHSLLLTTPGGRQVHVCGGEAAVILLRKEFDSLLVDRARTLGVTFRDRFAVTGLIHEAGRVIGLRGNGEEVHADLVICADGAHSRFSTDPRPKRTLGTIMGWWEDVEFEPGSIEMIFDRSLSPLYGWLFPETTSRVNIGLVVDGHRLGASGDLGSARDLFGAFLQQHFGDRLRAARQVGRWAGHPISWSTVMRHGGKPGVLYVGEAARLTNAATGEGIYQAMRSGILAADAVAAIARGEMREAQARRRYARRCRRTFTPGFVVAHLFRGAVRGGVLDGIAGVFGHPRARQLATWALGSALTGENGKWQMANGKELDH